MSDCDERGVPTSCPEGTRAFVAHGYSWSSARIGQRRCPVRAPPRDENDRVLPVRSVMGSPNPMIVLSSGRTGALWARSRPYLGAGCHLGEQSAPYNLPNGDTPSFRRVSTALCAKAADDRHAMAVEPRGESAKADFAMPGATSVAGRAVVGCRPQSAPGTTPWPSTLSGTASSLWCPRAHCPTRRTPHSTAHRIPRFSGSGGIA